MNQPSAMARLYTPEARARAARARRVQGLCRVPESVRKLGLTAARLWKFCELRNSLAAHQVVRENCNLRKELVQHLTGQPNQNLSAS